VYTAEVKDVTVQPPDGDTGPTRGVIAIIDPETHLIEIVVTGLWNRQKWMNARELLSKCLAEQPAGILLDLTYLDDPYAQSASLWFTAAREAGRCQPPIRIAVCLPDDVPLTARMRQLGARYRLAIYPNETQAHTALMSDRQLTDELRFTLPPLLDSAGTARSIAGAACREWDLHALYPRAVLVASELVGNAAEHAATSITLSLARLTSHLRPPSHQYPLLRLAVHDLDPALPQLLAPTPGAPLDRGLGLRIVDAAAEKWGAFPTRAGKLVWAILKSRPM
jgi:hypothetical protein